MSNVNLSVVDIGIVIAYLVLCLVIGLKKYGKIKTIRDYTLGTKPFTTAVLFCTTFATFISARQAIGYVGKGYELGLVFIIPTLFVPICWLIMAKAFLPNLEYFRQKKFMTLSDIMEDLYGKPGRWATNICAVIFTVGVTAVSVVAIGYLLHYFLHIPEFLGMLIGVSVVTIYSIFGGIQAVAITDVFQFLIFFLAIPIACAIGLDKAGGLSSIFSSLPTSHVTIDSSNIIFCLSLLSFAITPEVGIPYVQRALIAKDIGQFKKAFTAVGIAIVPFLVTILLIGLITHKLNPNLDSSIVLYYFIDNHLPFIIKGLIISGILAVIMSTQDSFLNTTSTLIARDICKQIWPTLNDKQQLIIARLSCVFISLISILIVLIEKDVLNIIWLVANFWDAIITIPLLAGLFGAKLSKNSFIVLAILVLTVEIIVRLKIGSFGTVSATAGVISSIVIIIIANYRYKKQNPELFPPKNSKPLFSILREVSIANNFSLSSLYIVSFITALNLSAALFFLDLTQYTVINYSCGMGVLLCLLLLLNELWNYYLRRFISYAWKFTIFFCLIWIPAYIVFASNYAPLWVINFALSATLFYLLTNAVVFSGLTLLGAIISYISFKVIGHYSGDLSSTSFAICSCFFTVITIVMHTYKQKYIDKEVYEQFTSVLEERVWERTQELREALDVKEEFLSKVSHEIRTPLQGIVGISTTLNSSWDKYSSEDRKKYVNMIASSGDRLMSYTRNILDFASYNKNAIKLNLEQEVDLIEIAKDVIQDSESLIISLNKPLEIILELGGIKTAQIECDRMKVAEIFYNLVNNAIKYSKAGKIVVKIETEEHDVKISVIDQGVGVPEDEKHDIFKPFTESTRTKTKAGGTGLGLSIVREIIYLHQGTVRVENNPPQGSKFIVTLPVQQDKGPRAFTKQIIASKGKILIVDDEPVCLSALTMILLDLGYEPYTAQGGVQALEYLKNNYQNVDIILLDLMMPDMNGIEVLKQIKNDPKLEHISVIMQSGYTSTTSEGVREAESRLGASKKSIAKPYNRDDVEASIALVVQKKAEKEAIIA